MTNVNMLDVIMPTLMANNQLKSRQISSTLEQLNEVYSERIKSEDIQLEQQCLYYGTIVMEDSGFSRD